MRILLLAIVAAAAALTAGAAAAADAAEPYHDDRSDPAALIRSLYNAIERREYARAWSYFSTKPAQGFAAYAEGFADTDSVRVEVGIPSEHDPGSDTVYYYVPVAIEASTADGDSAVYGGCYELRLVNPQLQPEESYVPLQIAGGRLESSRGLIDDALPATCDDGAPPDQGKIIEHRATSMFRASFGKFCDSYHQDVAAGQTTSSYLIRFKYSYASEDDPGSEARIFRFPCGRGAYNERHVYIMADQYGRPKILSFATPELDIRYQDDDQQAVESIDVIGFRSTEELVNSDFDPSTLTLTSWSKWRGPGDASSVGTWIFRDGEFALTRYDVDASYDGEINAQTVVDYHSGP